MSAIHLVQDYPHPAEQVWRALTDPELIPRWTAPGAGARPIGFSTEIGTRFQFVAKPKPGWDGIVNCVMLEADEHRLLRFSWTDNGGGDQTEVAYRLEPIAPTGTDAGGTRLFYDHTGFTGPGGFVMARLLGRIRRKMLTVGLPPVLAELERAAR